MNDLEVEFGTERHRVRPGTASFVFGRDPSCDVCIGPSDTGVSRVAGSLEFLNGTWWVVNQSRSRLIQVVDEAGLHRPVTPGHRWALDHRSVQLVVQGSVWTHVLRVTPGASDSAVTPHRAVPAGVATEAPPTSCSDKERVVLVAMCEGYLREFPRYDPRPATYAAIAQRLAVPRTTVVRRIERFRARLVAAGVPRLEDEDARGQIAEYVLSLRVITKDDLHLLEASTADTLDTAD